MDDLTVGVVETTFHVRYAETDSMGIVHHSAYIVWFEEGRSAWGRARGVPYNDFETTGYFLALTGLEARYAVPARYGMRITVRTRLEQVRSRSLAFGYEVIDADSGQTLATGATRHICVNAEGKPVRFQGVWAERLEAMHGGAP